jgi:hypothetical protein
MTIPLNVPKAVDFATDYTESPEWIAKMDSWAPGYAAVINQTITAAIANGSSPIEVARMMRQYATDMPVQASQTLTRTLQLTSYRDAALAMEKINGRFIEYKIRIATLRPECCLACVALHGTRLEPGQRVDDHYNGRCTEFYVVPGGPRMPGMMQADSLPGQRNFVPYQTGVDWFSSLPEERQAAQLAFVKSPGIYEAFKAGKVALPDFIGLHQDPVFGRQVIQKTMKAITWDNAALADLGPSPVPSSGFIDTHYEDTTTGGNQYLNSQDLQVLNAKYGPPSSDILGALNEEEINTLHSEGLHTAFDYVKTTTKGIPEGFRDVFNVEPIEVVDLDATAGELLQLRTINDPRIAALKDYTGNSYKYLNHGLRKYAGDLDEFMKEETLRGNRELAEEIIKMSERLDSLFEEMDVTTEDITVIRGGIMDAGQGAEVGDEISDYAYVSTSVNQGAADFFLSGVESGQAYYVINVPAGSKVIPVNGLSQTAREQEILLGRGSRFVVNAIGKQAGTPVYYITLLQ